ncbi:MAG TPA: hypothetical protein VFP49_04205 [Nitrososphaeraceae archaeon]|nr:hypothetical protein [Nitrososphaeraceae archaeon]
MKFISANKEYIEHLKKNNPDIEKIVIYKPIWLNGLRRKVHLLLFNHYKKKNTPVQYRTKYHSEN